MNNYLFLQLNRNLGYDLFTNDMINYIDDYIKIKKYYENGQLMEESYYKDAKKEGLYRDWYCEQLWEESNWKNGKKEGL